MTNYAQLMHMVDVCTHRPLPIRCLPGMLALARMQIVGWDDAYRQVWARIAYRQWDETLRVSVYNVFSSDAWSTFYDMYDSHMFTPDNRSLLSAFESLRIFIPRGRMIIVDPPERQDIR